MSHTDPTERKSAELQRDPPPAPRPGRSCAERHGTQPDLPPPNPAAGQPQTATHHLVKDPSVGQQQHRIRRLSANEVGRLSRRQATAVELKLFNLEPRRLPYPLLVQVADGGVVVARGERLISAAAAAGEGVEAEVFLTTTPVETALAILRATSTLAQPARNPIIRVDQVAALRDAGLTAARVAAAVGYKEARISQLLSVAGLDTTCPAAWRAFSAGWISERTARYISTSIRRQPELAAKAGGVIERAAGTPLPTRRWRRELLAELETALGNGQSAAATGRAPRTASAPASASGDPTRATPHRRSTDLSRRTRQRELQLDLFDSDKLGDHAPRPAA